MESSTTLFVIGPDATPSSTPSGKQPAPAKIPENSNLNGANGGNEMALASILGPLFDEKRVSGKSCAQLGWSLNLDWSSTVCATSMPTGTCGLPVGYADAAKMCLSTGGRLCSTLELEGGVALERYKNFSCSS